MIDADAVAVFFQAFLARLAAVTSDAAFAKSVVSPGISLGGYATTLGAFNAELFEVAHIT